MHRMLRLTAIPLALAFVSEYLTGQAPGSSQEGKSAFTMHVSLKQSTVKPGTDVVIDIAIHNTTEKQISVASAFRRYAYDVSYRAERTAPIAVKRRERLAKNGQLRIYPDRSWTESIDPHGTLHDTVVITEWFDLSNPGEYAIRLHRNDVESNQVVTSNTVILTVTSDVSPRNTPER